MLSEHDRETTLKSAYSPIEKWLKKIFHINSATINIPGVDKRDFFRLSHDEIQPLDLCLTMQDEQVFCTTIEDLSVSGFSCQLAESGTIHCGEPMFALFVLALEEPVLIRTEVFLVSIEGPKDRSIFHFRFFDEMNDDDRELIHRYISQKQFALLESKNKENWYEQEFGSLARD